jgi:hypothetical protein
MFYSIKKDDTFLKEVFSKIVYNNEKANKKSSL